MAKKRDAKKKKAKISKAKGKRANDVRHKTSSTGPKTKSRLSSLQNEMQQRLEGAKFRMLNQQLYTTIGTESFSTFQENPDLFDVYHIGFRRQAEKWPTNPIDIIIASIAKQYPKPAVIADFGCGDAQLALRAHKNKTVHSFDLVSTNSRVTAADMANVPLKDSAVDIAVYCLSLMSTNVRDCILEGHRVLKPRGCLKIAEVKSRFESPSVGGIDGFIKKLHALGFDLKSKDDASNRMFVLFDFVKTSRTVAAIPNFSFKACEYKRR